MLPMAPSQAPRACCTSLTAASARFFCCCRADLSLDSPAVCASWYRRMRASSVRALACCKESHRSYFQVH